MLRALFPYGGNMTIQHQYRKNLHWLPVEYRIHYKILLLAYKAQPGMAQPYLSSLLSPYKPGRSLRSEGKHLLTTPRYRLEGFGKCCFAHAAPSLWNTLPITIKCGQSIDISRAIWRHICLISHIHNCDVTFLSYCVFSPSFCLVSVWYHKRFWAWRLVAVEIGAIENWHYYYYYFLHWARLW